MSQSNIINYYYLISSLQSDVCFRSKDDNVADPFCDVGKPRKCSTDPQSRTKDVSSIQDNRRIQNPH